MGHMVKCMSSWIDCRVNSSSLFLTPLRTRASVLTCWVSHNSTFLCMLILTDFVSSRYLLYFRDLLTSRVPAIGYLLCEGEASKASCDVDTKYRSIRMIKRSWYHRSSRAEAEGECNLKEEFAAWQCGTPLALDGLQPQKKRKRGDTAMNWTYITSRES
jgi:hypothetical protein